MTSLVLKSPAALLAMVCSAAVLMLAPATVRSVLCVGEDGHVAIEATRAGAVCIDQEVPRGDDAPALGAASCTDTPVSLSTVGARGLQSIPVLALISAESPLPFFVARSQPVPQRSCPVLRPAAILRSVVLVI